jgi:hypothetical protein
MNRSTFVSISGPRITSLAAALSLAIASASLGAAGTTSAPLTMHHTGTPGQGAHANQYQALKKAQHKQAGFKHFQAAVQAEFSKLGASRPSQRAPATFHIASHADSGSGSLREILSNAVDGDVIDLASLHGTLTLGSALTSTANVTIKGPGRGSLTIDANHAGRAFTSSHSLKISNITIANGAAPKAVSATGGCILAGGILALSNVTLSNCTVGDATTNYAYGGAVAVQGVLELDNTTLSNNSATAAYFAGGGAAFVYGTPAAYGTYLEGSTLSGNSVTAGDGVIGGGLAVYYKNASGNVANVVVSNSTISGNSMTATSVPTYYNPTNQKYYYYGTASGGGAWTRGADVTVTGSHIDNNTQIANSSAFGGGLYSEFNYYYNTTTYTGYFYGGNASITGSTVSGNSSKSVYRFTYGAGMQALGNITIAKSTVANNTLTSDSTAQVFNSGGGVMGGYKTAAMSITDSTFSGNTISATGAAAYTSGGGISTSYQNSGTVVTITNSTISGNSTSTANTGPASTYAAGLYQEVSGGAGSTTINNSTVAFNTSRDFGAGIATNGYTPLTLNSAIVSNNTSTTYAAVSDIAPRIATFTVGGDYSLVQTDPTSYGVTFSGTHIILGSDPLLQPLANNGGSTQTHALDPASPAIDTGSNVLALPYDQRGIPFARVVGAAADIGAFELDTDRIFANGFE